MGIAVIKKPKNIKLKILARGNLTRYAPITPDTAPLAPIIGIIDMGEVIACTNPATIPQHT